MQRAKHTFEKLLADYEFETVLDYGCGVNTPHREPFEGAGKNWTGHDIATGWLGIGKGLNFPVDCVWTSHCLEHFRDPIKQLAVWRKNYVGPRGLLAITVPCWKPQVVGGHIYGGYTAGHLIYQLVLAGYDCSRAAIKTTEKEIGVIVRAPEQALRLPRLRHDQGDLEALAQYFPREHRRQGFDGRIPSWNW